MATRGRPPKQPISKKITRALEMAEDEIDDLMPFEEQNKVIPKVESPEVVIEPAPRLTKEASDDYDFARTNLHSLLMKGNEVLDGIMDVAKDNEHPRAFEVAGVLLKVLLEGTNELMTLQKDIRKVQANTSPANAEASVTNNPDNTFVFEGTTMDALELLEQARRAKAEKVQSKETGK
jgi:hypothetical protein